MWCMDILKLITIYMVYVCSTDDIMLTKTHYLAVNFIILKLKRVAKNDTQNWHSTFDHRVKVLR